MQIHKMLVSVNRLDRFDTGAVLAFDRDICLLDEGDALIARMADGDERLLIVRTALLEAWLAEHAHGPIATLVRLEQVDGRHLRVVLEPQKMLAPEEVG